MPARRYRASGGLSAFKMRTASFDRLLFCGHGVLSRKQMNHPVVVANSRAPRKLYVKVRALSINAPAPAQPSARVLDGAAADQSRVNSALQRESTSLAIFIALLLILATSGWLLLHSLSAGTAGVRIRLNWTAIIALGVPFIALAFLLVCLFVHVALRQKPHDQLN